MKQITLKIVDRIAIPVVMKFITSGGYAKFVTAKRILRKVELTEEEMNRCDVHDLENGVTTFNPKADAAREFEFTDREADLMKEALQRMDERKALSWDFIPLYEVFVLAAADPDETSHVSDKTSDISNKTSDVLEETPTEI